MTSWRMLAGIGSKNLLGDSLRSSVALVGVTFASLLMLLQSAIYLGFVNNASTIIDHCDGDLWMVRAGTVNFETAAPFSDQAAGYVRGTRGVLWAENLIYSFGNLKLPSGTTKWAHVIGFDPRSGVGKPWSMAEGSIGELTRPGTFLIDRSSLHQLEGLRVGDRIENFDHRAEIVGMSRETRTCTPNPVVYTSFQTAQRHIPNFAGQTNFVVIKLKDPAAKDQVVERLRRLDQFEFYTKQEFSRLTQHYWATKTGIGIGIGVTIVLGFVVGLVILGQTMYSATMARLEEFAALKIVGATNLQLCAIIWYQALVMAVFGFGLGAGIGVLLERLFHGQVISLHFSPQLMTAIGVATLVMCLGASIMSVRRVVSVSPAAVFRV